LRKIRKGKFFQNFIDRNKKEKHYTRIPKDKSGERPAYFDFFDEAHLKLIEKINSNK
jgi:hypothetical protein